MRSVSYSIGLVTCRTKRLLRVGCILHRLLRKHIRALRFGCMWWFETWRSMLKSRTRNHQPISQDKPGLLWRHRCRLLDRYLDLDQIILLNLLHMRSTSDLRWNLGRHIGCRSTVGSLCRLHILHCKCQGRFHRCLSKYRYHLDLLLHLQSAHR